MKASELARQALEYFKNKDQESPDIVSLVPGLTLLKSHETTMLEATVYDPLLCLILHGEKETTVGQRMIRFGMGESIIVSHRIPVTSRITQASAGSPYLALILSIDLNILLALHHEIENIPAHKTTETAVNANPTGDQLISVLSRYLALSDQEIELKVLGPLILREIHFRLLMEPHGVVLRKLLQHDSFASQINEAIIYLKENYQKSIPISHIARIAGMSESSFYENFKKITETTPLQYQKALRLIEAQRLLRHEAFTVSSAAFEVGYESPSQFSREYSRKFGYPPSEERVSPYRTNAGAENK